MAQQKKQVRTLHDRLKIIEEVEKNPGVKQPGLLFFLLGYNTTSWDNSKIASLQ
jgi:hypothetical protein